MYISVTIGTQPDALFGPDGDLAEIDITASIERYLDRVDEAIKDSYPEAEIDISIGPVQSVMIDIGDLHRVDEEEALRRIDQIIHKVWSPFDWIVPAEVTS